MPEEGTQHREEPPLLITSFCPCLFHKTLYGVFGVALLLHPLCTGHLTLRSQADREKDISWSLRDTTQASRKIQMLQDGM